MNKGSDGAESLRSLVRGSSFTLKAMGSLEKFRVFKKLWPKNMYYKIYHGNHFKCTVQ